MSKRRRKPLPQDPITTEIRGLSHEGRGIATVDERTTFISNALPDEKVEFLYTKLNKKIAEGKATTILQASPERVTPKCDYFGLCGGCSLQHMDHGAQLTLKQNTLRDHLNHFAKTQPEKWLTPLTGPQYAYRHKGRLGVRYVTKKESVLVGFREQQNRYLADMRHCKTLAAPVGDLIVPLRELIAQFDAKSEIAQIEAAIGDNDTALIFRNLVELSSHDTNLLVEFAKQHSLWIFLQPNKPQPLEKLWPNDAQDLLHYQLEDFSLKLWFHPNDFTQVNPSINRKMLPLAIELLDLQATDTALDLFCGLGNFTLPISRSVAHVVGIEGSEEMVQRASYNAESNNITNTEFFAADLSKEIDEAWANKTYNKLLLDPPRSGALEILHHIPKWQPEKIVYVACNPATLARDIGEIISFGYRLEAAGIIDMFPQTNHVESIALLVRN